MPVENLHVSGLVSLLGELFKAVLAAKNLLLQMAAHVVVKLYQVYVGLAALGSRFAVLVPALYQPMVRLVAVLPVEVIENKVLVRGGRFTVAQQVGVEVLAVNDDDSFIISQAISPCDLPCEDVLDHEVKLISQETFKQFSHILRVMGRRSAHELVEHHA